MSKKFILIGATIPSSRDIDEGVRLIDRVIREGDSVHSKIAQDLAMFATQLLAQTSIQKLENEQPGEPKAYKHKPFTLTFPSKSTLYFHPCDHVPAPYVVLVSNNRVQGVYDFAELAAKRYVKLPKACYAYMHPEHFDAMSSIVKTRQEQEPLQ